MNNEKKYPVLAINSKPGTRKSIPKPKDIIIRRMKKVITYENGARIEKIAYKRVNITKLVNETKKLVKIGTALEKVEEIEKQYTEN